MGHERETDAETGVICFHDDDKGMDPCTKAVWGVPAAIAPERSEGTYCAHNGNHREYDGQSDGELEQRLLNPAARTERRCAAPKKPEPCPLTCTRMTPMRRTDTITIAIWKKDSTIHPLWTPASPEAFH